MSATKRSIALLLSVIPPVAWLALDARAQLLVSTWDLRPGAPEAPFAERLVVAADNWMFRLTPFFFFAVFLVVPVIVILAGRRRSRESGPLTLRIDSFVWCGLGVAVACTPHSVTRVAFRASLFSLPFVLQWVMVTFWVMGAVSTYALLAVSGHRWPGLSVFVASFFGGPVGLFLLNSGLWAWAYRTRPRGGGLTTGCS